MSLIRNIPFLLIVFLITSCTSRGALTPVQCFETVKSAVLQGDVVTIEKNLSDRSLVKMEKLHKMISTMDEKQIKTLAALYRYDVQKMRNMKTADYIALYFFVKNGGVLSADIFKYDIVASDISGSSAVLRTSSGVELDFTREGPYWKLDISDL